MNKKLTGDWPTRVDDRDVTDGRPPKKCVESLPADTFGACGTEDLTYYPADKEWLCGRHAGEVDEGPFEYATGVPINKVSDLPFGGPPVDTGLTRPGRCRFILNETPMTRTS